MRWAALSAGLALVLMAAQLATIRTTGSALAVRIVLPTTIALVPLALWPHRRHIGVWVMYVGLAANLAAILANGGLMPIERPTVASAIGEERAAAYHAGEWIAGSKDVLVEGGRGRLPALGDGIVIRIGDRGMVASPGDLVVWAGIVVLGAEASWGWQRRRTKGTASEATRAGERAEGGAITRT
ncbi:MAG TPA: DUF5317 family protein [Dehalococcoidia bacterium]|nr:DUF5317 family protein [Dehalococcoidia bacterium]